MSEIEDILGGEETPAEQPAKQRRTRKQAADPRPEADRPKRQPLGLPVQRMEVHIPPHLLEKWHYHWINEERLPMAKAGGYVHVPTDEVTALFDSDDVGGNMRRVVSKNANPPVYGYLMKIEKSLWEEDQRRLEDEHNMPIQDAIMGGTVGAHAGLYVKNIQVGNLKGRPNIPQDE